jgi:propionate CoA-transferase
MYGEAVTSTSPTTADRSIPVRYRKIIPVEDAVALVQDGDVVASSGYGGNGTPEALFAALERRFLETGSPRGLTLVWAGGQGDAKDRGLNHLGHEGLLKRTIGGHYGLIPRIEKLALENKIEAYNFPEGVITHLYRDIAAHKPGTVTRVGLGTFVDPRLEGGKINTAAAEDLVELVTLGGEQVLLFKAFPIHVALIRGTTADPDGNITMERETMRLETLGLALAARNSSGVVLCQVERPAEANSLDPRAVRVPGIMVDAAVVAEPEQHMQTYGTQYNPGLSGETRVPLAHQITLVELDEKKVIARRAALELMPNSVVNLGIGLPDLVGQIANEERIEDLITLTVDPGVIGGIPLGGLDFGAALNFSAMIDHPNQFDFIDGGGLDMACLGFAECDGDGNVNASRFANRVAGCGGFINISQNSKKVVFVGTFTSGGLKTSISDGRISIEQEGRFAKFVQKVGQVTFSGSVRPRADQEILYVTERCVFRLGGAGIEVAEVAPGIDLDEILARLPFKPLTKDVKLMNAAIFHPPPLGLRHRMLDIRIEDRLHYDAETNTVFMNYAGMRVRTRDDIERILQAVDKLLKPLGKRVYSIVNYDRFEADPEIMDAYLDGVHYVEQTYYLKVSRYTNSGFMRLKLGKELGKRNISSHVYETRTEAAEGLRNLDLRP